MEITPFKIDVPKEDIDRLKRKLQDTRIPTDPIVPHAGSDYGTQVIDPRKCSQMLIVFHTGPPIEWFHRLYNKWLHDFDWRSVQAHLNRHQHFVASVGDEGTKLKIHFTHTRSSRLDAIPLNLIHGWPGSFHEFDCVVDAFTDPEDASDPAFHVVVPSRRLGFLRRTRDGGQVHRM